MNYIYVGRPFDINIGNGKTVSAVGATIDAYLLDTTKKIFSNIKLKGVDYTEFRPENIDEVLKTENALVILDELHAIVHKNHHIYEGCKHHEVTGLCYMLAQFFRQVRKRGIDTRSTCQVMSDAPFQYRQLMQEQIVCEKFHLVDNRTYKCESDNCTTDHEHVIKQTTYRNYYKFKESIYFDPAPYYSMYDSYEIVDGWVSYE